jgi:DNA-binding NtrC family response regulator
MENRKIIVVDDDSSFLRVLTYHIEGANFEVLSFTSPGDALAEQKRDGAAVIFTDIGMPEMNGIDFIKEVREFDISVQFVVISGLGSIDDAVEAMKLGALDFIRKPVEQSHLLTVLKKAHTLYSLSQENRRLKDLVNDHFSFGNMIGKSATMQELYKQSRRIAQSQATVLINGETGAGKEVLAKAIHLGSSRGEAPFVAINCAAIPENLIESELFGHIKGAFTGASTNRKGLIESANGGTFFMDEIGDLPLSLQPKLLRVLQEREFTPVGANRSQKVNIRFICATHKNLEEMVKLETFREDLFFRLNVIPLNIPPVRERKEDVLLLFRHFLKENCESENRGVPIISTGAAALMEGYTWPGNVREIQNIAMRCAVLVGDSIQISDLPISTKNVLPKEDQPYFDESFDLEEYIDSIYIDALNKNEWNQSKTARFLGISRNSLVYRLKREKLQEASRNKKSF